MGLFENLFKPRPDGTIERIVERSSKGSKLIEMREEGVEEEPPPDPATAFRQPKGYAPCGSGNGLGGQNQGFVPVLPSPKRAPMPERKPASSHADAAEVSTVFLTVGDILPRIPFALLRPGPHDLKRALRFQIEDLASDITRGRPAIALSCIAEQCPDLFNRPIGDAEDVAIRLPLQKLVEQVGPLRPPAPHPASAVAFPLARPPTAAPVERHSPEPPAPVVAPSVVAKVFEPVLPPPVAPRPAPPVVATPAPVPPVEVPAPIASPPASEEPPAPAPPIESAASLPEEPLPEPEPVQAKRPEANMIVLSLAAIVAKVPREMLPGRPPRIGDGDRISLPFPIIERQLGTGSVSIPATLFWDALPPMLRHHFILREDLVVPVPLEEIFQNLPVGGVAEKPRFDPIASPAMRSPLPEAPVVLDLGLVDEGTPPLDFDRPPPPMPAPENEPPSQPLATLTPAAPTAEDILLAPMLPAEPVPAAGGSAVPEHQPAGVAHLQPFRVFRLPTPEGEPAAVHAEAGTEPTPPMADAAPVLPSDFGVKVDREPESEVPAVEKEVAPPSIPKPLEPAPPVPPFSVAPALRPAEEPVVAFTHDQPPPLKIEEPAAAVAVLRASVPAPMESPVVAMATVSVQPPPMFRPMVLPPPVTGIPAPPPFPLAPTLAGPGSIHGMISLSPAAEGTPPALVPPANTPFPSPQPAPVVAAPIPAALPAAAPAPRGDHGIIAPAPSSPPPVAFVPPPLPAIPASVPAAPAEAPEPFHLHLPPLPSAPAPPPAHPERVPPALPMSRFDQHSLQSLFMTEEMLDLPKVARLAAALPGIQACVIAARGETFSGGLLPEGFQLGALRGLSPQVDAAADRLPIGQLKNFTLYGEQYSVSFFERTAVCLCAIHRARSFVPGVREKLVAVVDELARG